MELSDPNALSYPKEIAGDALRARGGNSSRLFCRVYGRKPGWEEIYLLAGVSLMLSVFNLLPVRALDGGQALFLALCWSFGPGRAETVSYALSLAVSLLLAAVGVLVSLPAAAARFCSQPYSFFYQSLRPARCGRFM
jgi:hypothetical protein